VALIDDEGNLNITGCGSKKTPGTVTPLFTIPDSVITTFQAGIDTLIRELGKTVKLIYDPTIIDCPNCEVDPIGNKAANRFRPGQQRFADGRRCPYCRGTGKTEEENSEEIIALIKFNPRDYKKFGISIQDPSSLIRMKTFLTDVIKIQRATTAVIDLQTKGIIKTTCRRLKDPIPTGLKESRYAITFWERI